METGDELDIKVGPLDNPQTVCFAAISNVYPYTILNNVQLVENQITIYKANAPGILMLSCINNSHGMESWGKKIEITLLPKKTNKGKKYPSLFMVFIHKKIGLQTLVNNLTRLIKYSYLMVSILMVSIEFIFQEI